MIPIPVVGPAEPWPAPSGPAARPETPVGAVDHTPAPRPPGPKDVQWWLSGYDNRVHAFGGEEAGGDFVEALCEHSVPNSRITRTDAGPRCVACLLILGDLLADQHAAPGVGEDWRQ